MASFFVLQQVWRRNCWTIVSKSTYEWPRVTTSDFEWPRWEWARHQQNIWNWLCLKTLIPGFDISAISDWMCEGLGDGQGGGMGSTNFPPPAPLISVPATFLNFFFPPFFPPHVHLPPSFLPGVPNSVHLPPYPPPHPLEGYQWPRAKKERKKVKMTNMKINKKVFCESTWFKEIFWRELFH